eukprot:Protomagalhaensia_sp_Gyna_25__2768@NODE_2599_length_988_cov_30_702845_g2160_i0_p2_GENE_NODE_2599_length_988_cov_30_702845_g2160_i0NODE_2599_length_988_cov_30_702845_g2160_i0_p2_ORF_typecomplete_len150_score3_47zfCHY/PF05495_12/1_7e18zfCHY/PF05495_12/36zfHIT/PF04438_16/2_8e03zfHIT/PF04438_16/4_1e02zfHIT/PF04438_16/0_0026zfHIT/PF04438_16/2_1e03zfHIT/PF04438_16/2_3e02_NODE_2599_length_988_cov_30_702845_g2160_i0477926
MEQGCHHYSRRCKLVSPCCDQVVSCHKCHDEATDHVLDRVAVQQLECVGCGKRQPLGTKCSHCHTAFGKYSCLKCVMFDDRGSLRKVRHCDQCGLCRSYAANPKATHCDTCQGCHSPRPKMRCQLCHLFGFIGSFAASCSAVGLWSCIP